MSCVVFFLLVSNVGYDFLLELFSRAVRFFDSHPIVCINEMVYNSVFVTMRTCGLPMGFPVRIVSMVACSINGVRLFELKVSQHSLL